MSDYTSSSAPAADDTAPRFLADENLEKAIVQGVQRQRPTVTFLTASEAGTLRLSDLEVLNRAKELDLILVTHDSATMYRYFSDFLEGLSSGEHSPGVLLVSQGKYGIGQVIGFLVDVHDLSWHSEWRDQIARLPL